MREVANYFTASSFWFSELRTEIARKNTHMLLQEGKMMGQYPLPGLRPTGDIFVFRGGGESGKK